MNTKTRLVMAVLAGVLLAVGMPLPVMAGEPVVGVASVIDGDTIDIHGVRIRFFGIDAPESSQTCARGTEQYRCGKDAAFALADKIGPKIIIGGALLRGGYWNHYCRADDDLADIERAVMIVDGQQPDHRQAWRRCRA